MATTTAAEASIYRGRSTPHAEVPHGLGCRALTPARALDIP